MIKQDLDVTLTATAQEASQDVYLETTVEDYDTSDLVYSFYYRESGETSWSELELNTSEPNYYAYLDMDVDYEFKVVVTDGAFASGEAFDAATTYCFVAGTKVKTKFGLVNIEDIKVGDIVYALNLETNELELKPVLMTKISYTTELYNVYVGDVKIQATPRHEFYVVDKGWVRAKNLNVGDMVLSNGKPKKIDKIKHEKLREMLEVYNFTVDELHNYLITSDSILVHNVVSVQ
jgi:hypothetical protein